MNDSQMSAPSPQVLQKGRSVHEVLLLDGLTIGNDSRCDIQILDEKTGSKRRAYCVTIKNSNSGHRLIASGYDEKGVLINGALFGNKDLVIGDYLQLGPCQFRFDGAGSLHLIGSERGGELIADNVDFSYNKKNLANKVLNRASLHVPKGHFVGIIGPSGAGKTTLLKAACGLLEIDDGTILIDGQPLPKDPSLRKELIGYVPQDDIVHSELSIAQALHFAAKIRLPQDIPNHEVEQLIHRVLGRLFFGFEDRDFDQNRLSDSKNVYNQIENLSLKRISTLSGGQRKRVSVAAELISRPLLLFLDEPSSGLDPVSETELMKMLRDITNSGCSIVCTTHVLENIWRMHSFALLNRGETIFQGSSTKAKKEFCVDHLSEIYSKLEEPTTIKAPIQIKPVINHTTKKSDSASKNNSTLYQLKALLHRQFCLFFSDKNSTLLFFGQPILIGIILSLVAAASDAVPYKLFFSLVIVFWFGCSNAASQIVRERAIVKRELAVGLNAVSYIFSKCLFFSIATSIQASILWLILALPIYKDIGMFAAGLSSQELISSALWQFTALLLSSIAATSIGLALSTWAKRNIQASFFVPLIVIPQILFAGFVFQLSDWKYSSNDSVLSKAAKTVVHTVAKAMPCSSGQRIMETSLVWDQSFDDRGDPVKKDAFANLRLHAGAESWETFEAGQTNYTKAGPAASGIILLMSWIAASLSFCWIRLRKFND